MDDAPTRTCIACKEAKPTTEFYTRKDPRVFTDVKYSLRTECKACLQIKQRAEQKKRYWAARDPNRVESPKPVQVEKVGCVAGGCSRTPPPITLPEIPCLARIDAKWPDIAEAVRRQRINRGVARVA